MKYVKAQEVLPNEILEMVQEYIDGEFLYIPRREGKQKSWGEKSGTRSSLKERNHHIYMKYKNGTTIEELVNEYYLSEQSIRRILSEQKKLFLKPTLMRSDSFE